MTVRGFVTADGRTLEHGQLGVPYTSIGTTRRDALNVGDLFDVRLDELRTVHEATLPAALER